MIPPDIASTLRGLVPDQALNPHTRTHPVTATQRVTDVLSNLVPGQRVMAEVQALLPNGSYRALVAQREVTLALPFSAKAGDTLELEVQENQGKLTLAFVANRSDLAQGKSQPASVATSLSQTGKMIGDLMQEVGGEGKRAPAAALNGNQALVSTMPKDATQLAPILKQALSQSGMFYEAHQARWVAGKLPTEQLRQEPQGRLPANLPPLPTASTSSISGGTTPLPQAANAGQVQISAGGSLPNPTQSMPAGQVALVYDLVAGRAPLSQPGQAATGGSSLAQPTPVATPSADTFGTTTSPGGPSTGNAGSTNAPANTVAESGSAKTQLGPQSAAVGAERQTAAPTGTGIPRDIAPIVQQQLDGLANQNFAWQGQVWPGQKMWWEIGENPDSERTVGEEAGARWRTRLKLDLPELGGIEVRLFLQADNQLSLRILTDKAESETQLKASLRELEEGFSNAGLSLRQIRIDHEQQPES